MKHAWRVCSYLFGAGGYGVRIDSKRRGQSVMDMRCSVDVEPLEQRLIEVVTDADYAGNQHDRKSTSSFQIFIDGNLVESKVRLQKAISLSSNEAEFVAMVAGCSEGLLIKHLWQQLTGAACILKIRSDSSAARAMTQRQGIGRVGHPAEGEREGGDDHAHTHRSQLCRPWNKMFEQKEAQSSSVDVECGGRCW